MPGQRKRKQRQQEAHRQAAARFAPGTGRWEVLFETQDESAWLAEVRRLRAGRTRIDWTAVRMDTFCGRSVQPTTYRLSLFVPTGPPAAEDGRPGD
ncbi:hypothetical protein OH807_07915 [Kitasatospora sp. NBC_01560]|uniref:hypothetical protein n=1 Tax=Kitasatospora sp. NBC_01560 TaxID=2975965 RepID=UPI003863F517